MNLKFIKASKDKDIKDIFDYSIDAFSDSPDFNWTLEEIKAEVKDGWNLYAVRAEKEVIASIFLKK